VSGQVELIYSDGHNSKEIKRNIMQVEIHHNTTYLHQMRARVAKADLK
jgi:hypothetical protein